MYIIQETIAKNMNINNAKTYKKVSFSLYNPSRFYPLSWQLLICFLSLLKPWIKVSQSKYQVKSIELTWIYIFTNVQNALEKREYVCVFPTHA